MTTDRCSSSSSFSPCELILKIGCNESDEISTAISSLLRSCSINEQSFFVVERQTQPTAYFGSFTIPTSSTTIPIHSQSLSCVLLLTDDILKRQQLLRPQQSTSTNVAILPKSKHFFKSTHIWNFHHKIELLDEYKQPIARQDYYELSRSLPLWSISHVAHSRQPIVRFNIFTQHFETMLTFYSCLFQRQPESSKPGFVLFVLPTPIHIKMIFQFSIKYSPSIQSYTIAQAAYLKFRLNSLGPFQSEYTSKLFSLNKFEYYIYDPDGNLLHLQLFDPSTSSNIKLPDDPFFTRSRPSYPNDSGVGESSDPSIQLFSSTVPQGYKPVYPLNHDKQQQQSSSAAATAADVDVQSHSSQSSHDSGRWSSISSNELNTVNSTKRTVRHIPITIMNSAASAAAARRSENDLEEAINEYRQKQQRTVLPRVHLKQQPQQRPSLYDSEPRISNLACANNRYYSSMNDVQTRFIPSHPPLSHTKQPLTSTPILKSSNHLQSLVECDFDISYEVDSPRPHSGTTSATSSLGYLNAFLLKKRQQQQQQQQQLQATRSKNVQALIAQFEAPKVMTITRRPVSAPLVDQSSSFLSLKPPKGILQRRANGTITPLLNKPLRKRSKSVTFECHSDDNQISSTDDERTNSAAQQSMLRTRSPRLNIGITLDSRLRKTPALDMLRSTAMECEFIEPQQLKRTSSLRQPVLPIARF